MSGTIQSTMIRASAGSGKTWQLSNRFLALIVLDVRPEKIIALTFTRKAAGEFTGRIMTRLAEGAASDEGADELAGELEKTIRGTKNSPSLVTGSGLELPTMDAGYFQRKLEEVIGVLDRLALSTLDSYFTRIVRNFALELGLSGFDLMEDAVISAERLSVMATIFSSRQTKKSDRDAFVESFKKATWGEDENRLCQTLEKFVKDHQNSWLSAPEVEKWGAEEGLWREGCPYPGGGNYQKKAEYVRSLLGEIENAHGSYLNSWKKACEWMAARVPGRALGRVPERIKDAITHLADFQCGCFQTVFYKREQTIKGELAEAIVAMVGGFIRDEIEVRLKRTQGLHAVIDAYEQRYNRYVRSRGRLCFSDLTLLLAGEGALKIWQDEARALIDYRLDARYDHWMLDEFQDTSRPQWQAVSNLVDEIVQDPEGKRSVFVVGDSKQAIYGWRGGEPRLFDDLKEHYGERIAEWDMDKSYRSSQHVLNLVNTVCDFSRGNVRNLFPDAAVDRWVYHTHTPSKEKPGHALVLETSVNPADNGEEKDSARYACMKALIQKISPLDQGMTCAVLVSKNDHVTEIVDYLRRELPGVPVASESEAVVADGPEGAVMLDLFRWLRNPSHHFGWYHVMMSPMGEVVEEITKSSDRDVQWRYLTGDIARYGVRALVDRLVTSLWGRVNVSAYGVTRLDEIQSAAHDFAGQGGSLDEWVSLLESRSLRESTRDGVIQVMTVHKCKGLGFDVVILPELDGGKEFTDAGRLDALERKGELGVIDYIIKKPGNDICRADPALSEMLSAWEAEQCYECFCNLYVALTRAKYGVYCILDPVKDSWKPKRKFADWIRESTSTTTFGDGKLELGEGSYRVLYESGVWVETGKRKVGAGGGELTGIKLKSAVPRMGRRIASAAKDKVPGGVLRAGKGMRFGSVVHQIFEQVTWLDELPELDDQSSSNLVRECLKRESIQPHFERPSGEFQLLREQPFETRHNGQWLSGVIDRAVIMLVDGEPASISLIDFKTDFVKSGELLREKYSGQLATYRIAMHKITGVPEERIECFLLSTALMEMVRV